jgi:PBP1b-binding outer membrane lipoprotein LpoB
MIRILMIASILLLSACASTSTRPEPQNNPPVAVKPAQPQPAQPARPSCLDCGVVKDIRKVTPSAATSGSTSAGTATKPGVLSSVLSKPSVQEQYEVIVQLLSGKQVLVIQKILSTGMKVGSKVRVSQGRILAVSP